jgi:hypothetical protein
MNSDNEAPILALKEAVRQRESDVEIVMEEAPVEDPRASGLAKNAVKNAQGQLRVISDALESRRGRRVDGEHQAVPWMVMHAAPMVNRGRKDDDGFSAHRRWRVAESGEGALCAPATSSGGASLTPDGKRERGQDFAWRVVSRY